MADAVKRKMKPLALLKEYFGYHPKLFNSDFTNVNKLSAFGAEIRALTEVDKKELCEAAAKALGVEVDLT